MNQYVVFGRRQPTEAVKEPEVFKMTIFAPNEIVAESRYWYYMTTLQKLRKSQG